MDENVSLGIRFVENRLKEKDPSIYLALETASSFGAKAVYLRFYNDNRPPRPQIYIFEETDLSNRCSSAELHHKLWNAGIVPLCFIFNSSQVLVFNCAKKPILDENEFITSPHDIIDLLSETNEHLNKYNAKQFDSGLFWDSISAKDFIYSDGAYEQLLSELKKVKNLIISRVGETNAALVKRVLMMLILIKYLEERKDEDGNGALNPDEFYYKFNQRNRTLEGVLENHDSFINLLRELSSKEHFNGQIFHLDTEEIIKLKKIDLTVFKYFVRGDVSFGRHGTGQMSLWRLYQFNYLPIELISHIYEDFLTNSEGKKQKGVVYTPPYLVQFLIDQCMPLSQGKKDFKIIDPACGSGIFLVGAFKRMIQWWRIRNNWDKPGKDNIEELKQLLVNNIFGCDLVDEAVTLSYFSLGLALLDALSPKEIWRNVHFDNLIGKNLIQGDFFKTLDEQLLNSDFDLVIGNPPFDSKFTDWAEKVNNDTKVDILNRPNIPDNQIALLFLEQSFNLLKLNGICCLILPSGPVLYNNGVHSFRTFLFEQYHFKSIFDFTPLRASLFIGSSSNAKPSVVSVYAQKIKPKDNYTRHFIFRRTKASGEKIEFEIDHYDIHKVSQTDATNKPFVWQANFMGGGRIHIISEKISSENTKTLDQFIEEKRNKHDWKVGEGWIEAPMADQILRVNYLSSKSSLTQNEQEEFNKLEKKYKAEWITGKDYVETTNFGKENNSIKKCTVNYFLRSRRKNKEIFIPPHLLIKENVTGNSIPVIFSEKYLTFKDKIFGIHAPKKDSDELKKIGEYLSDENCISLMWLLSGQVLTSREGVPLKADILSLPYPALKFDKIEKIILSDIRNYYASFRISGEKSEVLNMSSDKDLLVFGKTFCSILNSIYKNFKPLDPIVGNEFIAYPFVLGETPEIEIPNTMNEIETKLSLIINNKQGYNLWVKRIVKVYQKNVIFIYKPNQKRYWLPSIAVRDADETFLDLFNQGK